MKSTKFNLSCYHDWNRAGCNKHHVIFEGDGRKTICGKNLKPRRFDSGMESGDISSQVSMSDLSDRAVLNNRVCKSCLKVLANIGKQYNVTFTPRTWIMK